MLLSKQANHIARLIDNHRKQACDIAAQNTHVKSFSLGDSGILTVKDDRASPCLTPEVNLRFDENWPDHTSQATEAIMHGDRLEMECCQNRGTEHSPISPCIHQERHSYPGTIRSENLAADDGAYNTVAA